MLNDEWAVSLFGFRQKEKPKTLFDHLDQATSFNIHHSSLSIQHYPKPSLPAEALAKTGKGAGGKPQPANLKPSPTAEVRMDEGGKPDIYICKPP